MHLGAVARATKVEGTCITCQAHQLSSNKCEEQARSWREETKGRSWEVCALASWLVRAGARGESEFSVFLGSAPLESFHKLRNSCSL